MSSQPAHSRGIWIVRELQQLFDGPIVLVFALLTQLGDVWFLFLLASVVYVTAGHVPQLRIDRRQGAFILALAITYTVLIVGFKGIFTAPRPPGAGVPPEIRWLPSVLDGVLTNVTTAEGFGFPSGHALGATLVWGGLALAVDYRTRRTRLVIASGVIALVSFSRLALGVHYLVDVLAGIMIGTAILLALYRLSGRGTAPGQVFFSAIVFGAVGLLIGVTFESMAAFGGAVGDWVAWRGVDETENMTPASKRALLPGFAIIASRAGCSG